MIKIIGIDRELKSDQIYIYIYILLLLLLLLLLLKLTKNKTKKWNILQKTVNKLIKKIFSRTLKYSIESQVSDISQVTDISHWN